MAPSYLPAKPRALLAMRVSEVLEIDERVIDVLVDHGFTPLTHTHLRTLLAPTLTLAQAVRLRSLSPAAATALLDQLWALVPEAHRSTCQGAAQSAPVSVGPAATATGGGGSQAAADGEPCR